MSESQDIKSSKQLFLLVDQQLEEVVEYTVGIGEDIREGKLFTAQEKAEILKTLDEDGIVFKITLGREWVFTRIDSAQRKGILISFSQLKGEENREDMVDNVSLELDKVLKREIEEHQNTRGLLQDRTAKLKAIFDSTALFIWTIRRPNIISSFNTRFSENMRGWFEKEIEVGMRFFDEAYEQNLQAADKYERYLNRSFSGVQQHFELQLYTIDQKYVWVEIFAEPIYNEQNEVIEVSFIAFETTEKKEIEEQITDSLHEKERLLQEVHHRVKNNLQIISSILNLQCSYVKDDNSLQILKESQGRIKSMSFIHEMLYMSKNFGSIDIGEYIKGLTRNVLHSSITDTSKIELNMDFEEIELILDQAIPCGLIINEILSNSLKYAFPNGEKGKIEMSVKEKEGRVAMSISDNGIGMSEDFDIEESESLGLQFIYTLTEQLDGEIGFSGKKGTEYLITFEKINQTKKWPEPAY